MWEYEIILVYRISVCPVTFPNFFLNSAKDICCLLTLLVYSGLNPLPDDEILGLPKLKVFADDKLNITEKS